MSQMQIDIDGRMFSGLIFTHPDLLDSRGHLAKSAWKAPVSMSAISQYEEWQLARVQFKSERNFFNSSSFDRNSLRTDSGYIQELYVATARLQVQGSMHPVAAILSPYSRLMNRLIALLAVSPARFLKPDMLSVFEFYRFESHKHVLPVRISVNTEQTSVSLISLAGRNPIRSNLHRELAKVGSPYDVTLLVDAAQPGTNLHLDKHGNLWWYQSAGGSISNVLWTLSRLSSSGLIWMSESIPNLYRRKS